MRWYDFDGDEVRARDPLLESGRPAEPSGGASNHAAVEQPWTPWSYGARARTIVGPRSRSPPAARTGAGGLAGGRARRGRASPILAIGARRHPGLPVMPR